jgi:hypothetical protein
MSEDIRDFEEDEMDADGKALAEDGPGEPKRRVQPIVRTANVLATILGMDAADRAVLVDEFAPGTEPEPEEEFVRRQSQVITEAQAIIATAQDRIARFKRVRKVADRIESLDETGRKVALAVLRAEVES